MTMNAEKYNLVTQILCRLSCDHFCYDEKALNKAGTQGRHFPSTYIKVEYLENSVQDNAL